MSARSPELDALVDARLAADPADGAALDAVDAVVGEPAHADLDGDRAARWAAISRRLGDAGSGQGPSVGPDTIAGHRPSTLDQLLDPSWQPDGDADWDAVSDALLGDPEPEAGERSAAPMSGGQVIRPRRWQAWGGLTLLVAAAAVFTMWPRDASLELVTTREAGAPLQIPAERGDVDIAGQGPRVDWRSPVIDGVVTAPFPLEFRVSPGQDGVAVDLDSVRVVLLRGDGVDLTARLAPYWSGGMLRVPQVTVPAGRYPLELTVFDVEQRPTVLRLELQVQ